MLFKARPCPSCHAVHGHTRWAVANSSNMRGLRCEHCQEIFYQAGMGVWFWSFLLLPITPFFLIHWGVGLLAMAVETVLVMLYINRRKPLVAAHRRYE